MNIRVFGAGCAECRTLVRNVETAVAQLGLGVAVEYVTRVQAMVDAGITGTPALMVNGEIKSVGRAIDAPTIKNLLASFRTENAP